MEDINISLEKEKATLERERLIEKIIELEAECDGENKNSERYHKLKSELEMNECQLFSVNSYLELIDNERIVKLK